MSKQHICNCCVTGCSNTASEHPDLAFFSIPNDKRRDKWLQLISREDLKKEETLPSRSRRVCEKHFSRDAILLTNSRKTLKKTAFPTRCLPSLVNVQPKMNHKDDLPTKSSNSKKKRASVLTQTQTKILDDTVASVSTVLDCKDVLGAFYDLCDTHLTKDLTSLIKANNSLKYKKKLSNKDEYLQFCFNLYLKSPQTYEFFQCVYGLPNCDFILLKQCVQIDTKVNDIMLILKPRLDKMSAEEKNCSLLIGSVNLKANLCYNIKKDKIYGFQEINGVQNTEPATMALVMMIRGLFSNWKQSIGYILVTPNDNETAIENWIESNTKRLFEIGLNVRALVSSTKDDWINTILCKKSVTIDSPFLLIDDKKIYHIYDAPDLIKSLRDSLLIYDFHFQDKVAKYEDIITFYNEDQKKSLPYAHKLTESHISPNKTEKQEAKYAIQLMSDTVANGLWNYIQFKLIKNASVGTVEFISNVNKLFDILNVSKQNQGSTERKNIFREKETYESLEKILLIFQNLKVINPKNGQDTTLSVKFVKGILITIKAIVLLYDDLKMDGYSVLLTKNLHRRALDNYVNKLASRAKNKKLTTWQFAVAFKKLFLLHHKIFIQRGSTKGELTNFLAPTRQLDEEIAQSADAKKDLYNISLRLGKTMIETSNPCLIRTNGKEIKIAKGDYDQINTSEKHSLMYICGYLLMKAQKIHKSCYALRFYLHSHMNETDLENGKFGRYNEYMQDKAISLPAAPCNSFIRFVKEMDEKFVTAFTSKHLPQRIVDSLYEEIAEISYTPPCSCFPKKYVATLFIRIKIFYTIRMNNKLFKTNSSQKCIAVPELYN